jgi:hypothetical protein
VFISANHGVIHPGTMHPTSAHLARWATAPGAHIESVLFAIQLRQATFATSCALDRLKGGFVDEEVSLNTPKMHKHLTLEQDATGESAFGFNRHNQPLGINQRGRGGGRGRHGR